MFVCAISRMPRDGAPGATDTFSIAVHKRHQSNTKQKGERRAAEYSSTQHGPQIALCVFGPEAEWQNCEMPQVFHKNSCSDDGQQQHKERREGP